MLAQNTGTDTIYVDVYKPLSEEEIAGLLRQVCEGRDGTLFNVQVCLHRACLGAVTPDPEGGNYCFRFRLVAAIYMYWFLGDRDLPVLDDKTIRFFAKLIHKVANLSEASVINMREAFKDLEDYHLHENLVMAILREFLSV